MSSACFGSLRGNSWGWGVMPQGWRRWLLTREWMVFKTWSKIRVWSEVTVIDSEVLLYVSRLQTWVYSSIGLFLGPQVVLLSVFILLLWKNSINILFCRICRIHPKNGEAEVTAFSFMLCMSLMKNSSFIINSWLTDADLCSTPTACHLSLQKIELEFQAPCFMHKRKYKLKMNLSRNWTEHPHLT